ncbi:ribonuclease HII [Fibrobacter sp. UWB11]|uniref:ribonuclease HII n=1 Tax=Fibrobacter sp. UWB11 TaxID=1896202 RepID=UPI00092AC937|nr:ribonuclease HII [Fibrobacter sp. UWB11]SIN97238.1 RNase HII [Fibrobacter sp. UWB11]
MKFKLPAFLENIESPVEGEVALRKYAANPLAYSGDGTLDLFSSAGNVAGNSSAIVVGIDEVGRGPLAGPVVACAAVLKTPDALLTLNDSKKLSRLKREAMFDAVKDACACYAIASASVEEIDEINILEADFLAMRRALQALGFPGLNESAPEIPIEVKGSFAEVAQTCRPGFIPGSPSCPKILIAVDGNLKIDKMPQNIQMPIVKGDGRIASISAASILAKVFRDRYMDKLEELYPGYGFDKHAGYGTKAHLDAIRRQGFTPAHRKSFHPKSL